jgi:hypothetical protein
MADRCATEVELDGRDICTEIGWFMHDIYLVANIYIINVLTRENDGKTLCDVCSIQFLFSSPQ